MDFKCLYLLSLSRKKIRMRTRKHVVKLIFVLDIFFFFSELSLLRERRDTVEVEKEEVETGPIGLEMHLSQSPPSP